MQNSDTEASVEDQYFSLSQKFITLEHQYNVLKGNYDTLKHTNTTFKSEIKSLRQDLQKKHDRIIDMRQRIYDLHDDLDDVNRRLDDAVTRLNERDSSFDYTKGFFYLTLGLDATKSYTPSEITKAYKRVYMFKHSDKARADICSDESRTILEAKDYLIEGSCDLELNDPQTEYQNLFKLRQEEYFNTLSRIFSVERERNRLQEELDVVKQQLKDAQASARLHSIGFSTGFYSVSAGSFSTWIFLNE
ncbi:hypothetical protein GUITHDRAFT_120893 [Guillardia theta CCMP2712]|uniref:J domain-containing protein n=1 Tax=Guillardia theta (strain CCMP2712) TaxID=905079 RepID=L1I9I6_GUITC|nr:hypothetical protein GUITHDRAFT_120893 [Guillardia theta CCMP2712]EKX32906.1 hypothetical protein GUITHDRAFT_120893 [Guillardia theta CCMP2712]|eukprot:XP_005819886.1 hypothetical protein GUITHDRAFT_120893 [Guillardia theta CCMP2712]